MNDLVELTAPAAQLLRNWPLLEYEAPAVGVDVVKPPIDMLERVALHLRKHDWRLGTIVATDEQNALSLRYCFYRALEPGWLHLLVQVDQQARRVPSLTPVYISADRHEREVEDLFLVSFAGHPRLGDFVLHDDKWAENIGLMRPQVAATKPSVRSWKPHRVLEEPGAFVMPLGPVFSGHAESALFLLETVGEDVVRAVPRLFYKYRAIEKLAEGRSIADVLLLVERCNGTNAIGNAWAYCNAVETALPIVVPARAHMLRTFLAELERVRHHVGAIRDICESTALSVAANEAAAYEEELLRLCARLTGHRYLFGLLAIGGLARDLAAADLAWTLAGVRKVQPHLTSLRHDLERTGSFLDRIEDVGIISPEQARTFELIGPMARASDMVIDMRVAHAYGQYPDVDFVVPTEREGDGFARLRVLFSEIEQSIRILEQLPTTIDGSVRADVRASTGSALGWAEAPRGASLHWVDIVDGRIKRYHCVPPSFRNWHGFHIATEDFAFQDFPIILATLDLSVAENDR